MSKAEAQAVIEELATQNGLDQTKVRRLIQCRHFISPDQAFALQDSMLGNLKSNESHINDLRQLIL